jgi:two-component system nitrogen regulation sensor histidine kinase GlnL
MVRQSYSFITDNDLRITGWNERVAELTRQTALSVLGRKYYEVVPRIFVDDDDALSLSLRTKKDLVLKEYSFHCIYGQVKADVFINSSTASDGKSTEAKVTISHLTDCPVTDKLRESQRFIDIGKTASWLAHGVRNPLNAIKGSVVYLRGKYSDEPTLIEFTKIMEEEISRLDKFISQFLSRSLSDIELSSLDINMLLKKIKAFTALQTYAANIEVMYEYGDCPAIRANAFQLEQAILNVINNSVEAMRSGGRLFVRTGVEKRADADFIVIEISDTGSGISASDKSRRKTAAVNSGRGFGLSITREALQYYGGHLEIRSEKNKGTATRLYLPVTTDFSERP